MRHRFWLRYLVINIVGFFVLLFSFTGGLLDSVIASDRQVHICLLIFVIFLTGLITCGCKVYRLNSELNYLNSGYYSTSHGFSGAYFRQAKDKDSQQRQILANCLESRLSSYIAFSGNALKLLLMLGFIGTLIGALMAFGQIDKDAISDASLISSIFAAFLSGVRVAIYTTVVGAITFCWLYVNDCLLNNLATELCNKTVEAGESLAKDQKKGGL